jgi:D-3-phosphoglycerate dehydrogenase
VTPVNARSVAATRGIDIVESSSTRARDFRSLLSVKLTTDAGERWAEGTVGTRRPRLVRLDGVHIEAPLGGTLLLIKNNDQPGVIGDVGTILGRHGVNIANFALGRGDKGAVGLVTLDDLPEQLEALVLNEIRAARAIKDAWIVRI